MENNKSGDKETLSSTEPGQLYNDLESDLNTSARKDSLAGKLHWMRDVFVNDLKLLFEVINLQSK